MTIINYLKQLALSTFKVSKPVFVLHNDGRGYIEGEVKDKYQPNEANTPITMTLQGHYSESFDRSKQRFEMGADHMARQVFEELEETILDILRETLELKKPKESAIYQFTKDVLLDGNNAETDQTKLIIELYSYIIVNSDHGMAAMKDIHKRNVVAILYKVKDVHEARQKVNKR